MASAVASTSSNRLPGHRYKINSHVTNPAYVTEISQSDTRCSPQDALKHMQSLDLCDITVINPLFHSGIPFSDPEINRFCSVDMVVKNQFFGMGVPRYEKIQPPRENSLFSQSWVDEYPLHSAALEGDIPRIKQLLRDGYNPHTLDKDSWAPIHCACWYGKAEAVKVLLQQGRCSPTIANGTGSTPLHFAAMKGYARVVKILLAHQEIDKSAVDKDNKTPLQLCEESQENEWEQVSAMLREALKKPAPKIDVHLMDLDSSHVVLDLVSGNNTTVEQLLRQLGELPVGCEHLFAIWIASQNLHLQLRPTHKPIMEVRDWEFTIRQFTNYKPERERPYLYLRRNALLSLRAERQVGKAHPSEMHSLAEAQNALERDSNVKHGVHDYNALKAYLQMRAEHKPLLHIKSWEIIVKQLTNYKPEAEKPRLYLRRDAKLPLSVEREIKDSQANKMLFDECVLNVLRSMYPTSDQDAINLAAILMQIIYGDHDPKKHRSGFLNNINLRHFIPTMKLVGRSQSGKTINWAQKIVQEHKNVTAKGIKEISKLQVMYLEYCRTRFPAYGSAFFFGFAPPPSGARNPIGVYIGVNSQGIHLIKADSKTMIYSARYDGLQWECTLDKGQFKLYRKEKLTPFIEIKTKQAAIICNLMGKLSGQIPHPMSKQQQPQQTHQQFPPRRSSSSNSKR